MWESIFLTLAATAGNNIGKILQKKGTVILPPLSFKLKVIRAYALNKAWLIGFMMDIFGALLMLRALSLAPVSVIQPVSGCGLAILSIFSHFYLKEMMNAVDWMGITLAGIGTIGVGAGGEEQKASTISVFHLPWSSLMGGYASTDVNAKNRSWMASVISKMGFVFLEQGFHSMLVPICVIISICCSGTGFYYQTWGLKHGRAIVVSTCAAVASIVTGVLAGMLALGERLPSAPTARLSLMLGWLLIIIGVILLVSSTRLMRRLPRPLRQLLKSGVDQRKPGSIRVRDGSPSTVIQAATLHHLIPTASKEKA
ncbi:hypothetical protein DVH24_012661 [Malus domestica]|uniref:Probable magnesium transporter n=1 Tax=Malus domestica TaxID=3750 RepID=A0A498HU15_MALDO|nr:hypothetical protein DVH24_012661 [Malus domestica]